MVFYLLASGRQCILVLFIIRNPSLGILNVLNPYSTALTFKYKTTAFVALSFLGYWEEWIYTDVYFGL